MADETIAQDFWRETQTGGVRAANTPEEMRAEIFRLERCDPLVRTVMVSANYRGASAEDRYTLLAYNALKQLSELKRHVLEQALYAAHPPYIVTAGEIKHG